MLTVDVASSEDVHWSGLGQDLHRDKVRTNQIFAVVHQETGFRVSCRHNIVKTGSESPRHHHNFDQIRYVLEGHPSYGKGPVGPGTLGYFPESVFYGPQTQEGDVRYIVMQFPGPSPTSWKFPTEVLQRARRELKAEGVVMKDGVAHFPDGKKQEATEAAVERILGKQVTYAPPRYTDPVFIKSENFPWRETSRPGLFFKHLAYFNECGPNISILRLEAGASTSAGRVGCIEMRVVLNGQVEYGGKRCPAVSRLYFPPHVPFDELTSQSGAEVLVFQIAIPGGEAPPLHVV
jgi:hypothetical protein